MAVTISKYFSDDTLKYIKRHIVGNYIFKYVTYLKDNYWCVEFKSFLSEYPSISFKDIKKDVCERELLNFFEKLSESDEITNYMINEYDIVPNYEDVMYSVREKPFGYHISKTVNRETILKNGLVSNGNRDEDVIEASVTIDTLKPEVIPEWVKRQNALYAYPLIDNFMITSGIYRGNDLYAVKLHPDKCWVGSEGLGGFCLFDREFTKDQRQKHIRKCKKYGKDYWKYSCSLNEFILNTPEVKRKDRYYGLDEILTFHTTPVSEITFLGNWDDSGDFCESSEFVKFVKPSFACNLREILGKYIKMDI